MFGDILHGSMLIGITLWVYYSGERNPAYPYRNFLLLMGIFATYTGIIYNDFTSIPLYLFGDSCYQYVKGSRKPIVLPGCVYPVGIDPSWYLSSSEITFSNSVKMKIAVIFGVVQMSIGVLLKGSNSIYFHKWLDFFFEFIP